MKQIKQSYVINAPAVDVWQAFIEPKMINTWGGGPAKMDDVEGSKFSLWDGNIFGTNTKVVKHKLIEQDWFSGKDWPEPSQVSFSFKEVDGKTTVELIHRNIPDSDAKDIEQGWKDYYLGPIQQLVEN